MAFEKPVNFYNISKNRRVTEEDYVLRTRYVNRFKIQKQASKVNICRITGYIQI